MNEWIKGLKEWAGRWPKDAASYFAETFGLDSDFALRVAMLYLALYAAGLNPRITSGYRDGAKQDAMRKAWDAGQRQGLRARPAKDSLHTIKSWLGKPGAKAVDIVTTNDRLAADIGQALGLRAGYYFTARDPGHFDVLGA